MSKFVINPSPILITVFKIVAWCAANVAAILLTIYTISISTWVTTFIGLTILAFVFWINIALICWRIDATAYMASHEDRTISFKDYLLCTFVTIEEKEDF